MSLARTDIRFTLPVPARSAAWLADASGWGAQLAQLGLLADGDDPAELIVASPHGAGRAVARGARAVIVVGDGRRALRGHGLHVTSVLALPDATDPAVFVPFGQARAARYALGTWASPSRRWKAARNAVVAEVLGVGRRPPGTATLTVASRDPGPPFLVRAAEAVGVPRGVEWFLVPGQGSALTRGAFFLFRPGASRPEWVLKFSRSPGREEPFVRDERGLRLAARAGPSVAAHAPGLLGRLELGGFEASVESAAPGRSLIAALTGADSRARKLDAIERVAAWTVSVAAETAGAPEDLAGELRRLRDELIPAWGAPPGLADGLESIAPVLQHNDLGTWNIFVSRDDFTVLDWESVRERGLPLWDLWYFLADALAHADGASDLLGPREEYVLRLFRGELASSELLFSWTRRAVAAAGVPPDTVGRLATLAFLHHGRSWVERGVDVRAHHLDLGTDPWLALLRRLARHWLTDPALGPGWDRWRA